VIFSHSSHGTPSKDDSSAKMKVLADDPDEKDYKFDFDLRQIDDLLPDEDEFFAGITDETEPIGQTNTTEELEEFDVFGNGGGMELDIDPVETITVSFANSSIVDGARGNGINPFGVPNTVGTVAGEHPFGEHPSRTLFVRNINSNVEDSELRSLFEVLTSVIVNICISIDDFDTFMYYATQYIRRGCGILTFNISATEKLNLIALCCYFSNMGISVPFTLQQSIGAL
jgi:hypothetical protein